MIIKTASMTAKDMMANFLNETLLRACGGSIVDFRSVVERQ